MKIGSLFSGIGGLELGLEMAGVGRPIFQVEKSPFCRRILEKHWPEAVRHEDVRDVGKKNLPFVDVLCGGFPCQDVSAAGRREGLAGSRSSLWFEYLRIAEEITPHHVVVENVASGARLWLPQVRGGLEALGYRTRALALSAADVGAPHIRKRIFVLASYAHVPQRKGDRCTRRVAPPLPHAGNDGSPWHLAASHPDLEQLREQSRWQGRAKGKSSLQPRKPRQQGTAHPQSGPSAWTAPPRFRGMDDGFPHRLDRLRALGNAVVPQCAEVIGRILLADPRLRMRLRES